jgi:N6-adenosine-specific RNA methylase IME4
MKYDIILADPPWAYEVWDKDTGSGRSAESHYPTMTLDDICKLPVAEVADKNCVLFIWGVWPSIFDVKDVIESWGFKYKTLAFEWVKLNTSGVGWHVGMGYYTRANPEPCLLAVRGKAPVVVHDERNLLVTYEDEMFGLPLITKRREHSRKPDEQYGKIERLYPHTLNPLNVLGSRRLEMFARRSRPGWDVFGNEVENSISLQVNP